MTHLEHALAYAAKGWAVFPLAKASKSPITEHGFKEASTDPKQIRKWWRAHPHANIGIATGRVSGIIVVDVDPKNGGDLATFWKATGLDDHKLGLVTTGSDGSHLYFRYPDGIEVPSRIEFVKGVDLKSDGGYVVAPPSVHPNGVLYAWAD